MRIPLLEEHRGERFAIGDVVEVWNHKLKIIDRRDDALRLRIDSEHSCWFESLPADVVHEKRLELA